MDDPRIAQARPGWALAILSAPIFVALAVVLLYVGMWSMGLAGREAAGAERALQVEACPEGVVALRDRLTDMGLPAEVAPTPTGARLTTRATGRPEVDQRLTTVLSAPGRFELRGGDVVLATSEDVAEASSRLDGMMDPWLLVRLREDAAERVKQHVRADPRGRLHFAVDGVEVAMQPNTRDVTVGEVEGIPLADMDRAERFHRVAEWAVLVDHPLPCAVEIQEVQRVERPPG